MVRNIVVLGGNSHPKFVDSVCSILGLPSSRRVLEKFSCGESRCEIQDSVRGKDVYIVQSFGCGTGGDRINDHFIELCIMISACKTGSAKRVTAVLPLFPYSRQPDIRYSKAGAPLAKANAATKNGDYTFESLPATPGPNIPRTVGLSSKGVDITDLMNRASMTTTGGGGAAAGGGVNGNTNGKMSSPTANGVESMSAKYTTHNYENLSLVSAFQSKPGYKQWVAQAGTLVANLLTCAGADRVLTCDLHESTYQGFFDIPVDNLYGRSLLQRYIRQNIENYKDAVIVSPDAGGAKRATAIADRLGLNFALIHKVIDTKDCTLSGSDYSPSPMLPSLEQAQAQAEAQAKARRAAYLQTQIQAHTLDAAPASSHGLVPTDDDPDDDAAAASSQQERRPTKIADHQKATMMLVGDVANRVCILVDDLADTAHTITRAAKLLKNEGATKVIALLTHGVFSGDALARVNASALDRVVVTNTVAQDLHQAECPKLEVLDIAPFFAEGIRRLHHGESISVLFQYD